MGRKSITQQIKNKMIGLQRFGQSKHYAKIELKERMGENFKFGMTPDGIYSISTYDTYKKEVSYFVEWCQEEHGLKKYDKMETYSQYKKEYLEHCYKEKTETPRFKGQIHKCSIPTLKLRQSALNKVFSDNKTEITFKERTDFDKNIHRSRHETKSAKNFSKTLNKSVLTLCSATGGRRTDIKKMKPRDFFYKERNLYVEIKNSKGGKNRIVPVLKEYQPAVEKIIKKHISKENEPMYPKINKNIDVHGIRREYAQSLYKDIVLNGYYREEVLSNYRKRYEPNIKREVYVGRKYQFKGLRDDVYAVTQALGHNRLSVTVMHYLSP